MSKNAIGTVLRIAMITFNLLIVWFLITGILYKATSLMFGIDFSFFTWTYIFIVLMLFRMFYPKNAFI